MQAHTKRELKPTMEDTSDSAAFAPMSHPLGFASRKIGKSVYDETPLSPHVFNDIHDSQEASRSFEMGDGAMDGSDAETHEPDTIAIRTTTTTTTTTTAVPRIAPAASAGPSPASTKRKVQSATVHIDPHRSHTVAAAAAAKQKAEEEAAKEPLTAENETWGHWSFRHAFNGFIMMLVGFYQVVQAGARRQPVDMNTITYTNSVYMSAPPRAEELKKQQLEQEGRGRNEGAA